MLSFETDVDYKEIKSSLGVSNNKTRKHPLYCYICLCLLSFVCLCCLCDAISARNDVTHLQQRMLLLLDKNSGFAKEQSELETQIPLLHKDNTDLQSRILEVQKFVKGMKDVIVDTEKQNDKLLHK